MGPEATLLLMQKVLDAVPAQDDADHIPLIVHQNSQVPSRIAALIEGHGADPGPVLADMARGLEAAGAAALAMPCNTAHHYAPAIRAASHLPFLDMLSLSSAALAGQGARRIGMLASPATRRAAVFDAPFAAQGLEPVWTGEEAALLGIIRAVKAGRPPAALLPDLSVLAEGLLDKGADHLLVGCTELSLMTHALPAPVTDTLDCLVAEIVRVARAGGAGG